MIKAVTKWLSDNCSIELTYNRDDEHLRFHVGWIWIILIALFIWWLA